MASITKHTTVLGRQHARHLLRRAGFGGNINDMKHFAGLTPDEAFAELSSPAENPEPPVDPVNGKSWVTPDYPRAIEGSNSEQGDLQGYFKVWHFEQMLKSGNNLTERMTWFLHSHLPVSFEVVNSSEAVYYQNALFRHYALGNFKTLFKKICFDNAMLIYLDNDENHKDAPNENFAREMLELYSIGRGPQIGDGNYTNYTEDDIKAATRVLSGWETVSDFTHIDPDTGLPTGKIYQSGNRAPRHDAGEKTFTEAFDNQNIAPAETESGSATVEAAMQEFDDMIEMIFAKKETARFICRKLYRFLVYWDINTEIENDIIEPMAASFIDNDYELLPVLRQLLTSRHFYDSDNALTTDNNIGAGIKSPIEIYTQIIHFFDVPLPDKTADPGAYYARMQEVIVSRFEEMNLFYYQPFEVAGYPAYHQAPGYQRNWITPSGLAQRYRTSELLIGKPENASDTLKTDIVAWVENSGFISAPTDPDEITSILTENLLAVELDAQRYNFFRDDILLDTLSAVNWANEWYNYKNTGNDTNVRQQLELLITAIIQSPEFQLN